MKVALTIVCSDRLASGFALAGVNVIPVRSAVEAQALLKRRANDAKWGLVFVEAGVMQGLSTMERDRLTQSLMPVFVEIPLEGIADEAACVDHARESVARLLTQAVGTRIEPTL